MAWVIVLEQDEVMFRFLKEALETVDPSLEIIRFKEVREFLLWLGRLEKKDPETIQHIPKSELRGLISEIEGWGFRDISLIQKLKPLFIKLEYITSEDDTCILLTGHDHPKLLLKRYEHRFVNNFVFKPFDKLLLSQIIETAFIGRNPVKKYHINNFKTETQIEMLKEVKLTEISEAGFQTISNQEVAPDTITKFYADFLETNQHRSAFGRALRSNPIADTKLFRVEMGFFALDQQQSFNLQKMIKAQNNQRTFPPGTSYQPTMLFVGHEKSTLAQQLQPSFSRFFDCETEYFKDLGDFAAYAQGLDAFQKNKEYFIFVDAASWVGNEINEVASFRELYKDLKAKIFLLSTKVFNEKDERELTNFVDDMFYAQFNKSYLIKSIKMRWPEIKSREEIFTKYEDFDQIIYVSNLVQLKEVSEAGLVLKYYRELPVGTFREFIFWMPNEVNTPEIVGQCNYVEYDKENKCYNCHFIFFGMRDFHLKHIRLWVLQHYIDSKKEGS